MQAGRAGHRVSGQAPRLALEVKRRGRDSVRWQTCSRQELMLATLSILILAALLAVTTDHRHWPIPVILCLVLSGLGGFALVTGALRLKPMALWHSHKHLGHVLHAHTGVRIVDSRWSAVARTDVVALSSQGESQYIVFTDGGAATALTPLPMTPEAWQRFDQDVGLFPYHMPPREHVLIIGSGGGLDVLLALRGGARAITAVEINPDVLRTAERFIPPARNVYHLPQVQVIRGDGRQFVRQTTRRYDLIVLPQVYTGAAQRQGGGLVENYVLTTEAFQDYLAHLTPRGRLVVHVHEAAEVLKTVFMALEALARRGVRGPTALDHLLILQETADAPDTPVSIQAPVVILSNAPYTVIEGQQQAAWVQETGLTALFMPHSAIPGPFTGLLLGMAERDIAPAGVTVRPATDDRPFFYETSTDLRQLFGMVLAVLVLLLGLYAGSCLKGVTTAGSIPVTWLPFFAAIGGASLLVQVALLQRYLVVLDSPPLTLVVLLFPLLIFGGVGSVATTYLSDWTLRRLLLWSCLALACLLGLSLAAFPFVRSVLEHQPPVVRILTLMLFLAPLGLLLGAPFPIALQLLGRIAPTVIPWVWSINAVACVLGSVGAAYGAIAWGLSTVLGLGAGIYVVAAGWALYMLKHTPRHIEGANASPIAGV